MAVNALGYTYMPYQEAGANTKEVTEVVRDENGEVKHTYEKLYDENGNFVQYKQYDADGNLEYSGVSFYNEDDRLVNDYQDDDGDGIADVACFYSYYDNGSMKKLEIDNYADGTIDNVREFEIEYSEEELQELEEQKKAQEEEKLSNMNFFQKTLYKLFGVIIS